MDPGKIWLARKMTETLPSDKFAREEPPAEAGVSLDAALQIRAFQYPDDYPAVIQLWANAGDGIQLRRSDEAQEIEKKLLRDPDLFLLAENKGELIGAVLGGFDGRRGMMYHLAVRPDQRQQGIGTALMQALEERLKAKGCIRYYLLVTLDNDSAIRFYESQGWERMQLYAYGKNL
jgi:ribosomal protein S18 acetylase RimI-like enzyme